MPIRINKVGESRGFNVPLSLKYGGSIASVLASEIHRRLGVSNTIYRALLDLDIPDTKEVDVHRFVDTEEFEHISKIYQECVTDTAYSTFVHHTKEAVFTANDILMLKNQLNQDTGYVELFLFSYNIFGRGCFDEKQPITKNLDVEYTIQRAKDKLLQVDVGVTVIFVDKDVSVHGDINLFDANSSLDVNLRLLSAPHCVIAAPTPTAAAFALTYYGRMLERRGGK